MVSPELESPSDFGFTSNAGQPWNPQGNQTTINYFPKGVANPNTCTDLVPTFYSSVENSLEYAHPSPYSLVGAKTLNSNGAAWAGYEDPGGSLVYTGVINPPNNNGLKHTYPIDQSVNLTLINPSERIIYNPSEVEITNSTLLVFPSGYTFKTINAIYPGEQQVTQVDPSGLYPDPTQVPVTSVLTNTDDQTTTAIDERLSYYYIQPGCTLRIEPCVTIMDAVIKLMGPGARLEYDANQVYGNFTIDNSLGSTIVTQTVLLSLSFPQGIINEISAAQSGISPRSQLEAQIEYMKGRVLLWQAELVLLPGARHSRYRHWHY